MATLKHSAAKMTTAQAICAGRRLNLRTELKHLTLNANDVAFERCARRGLWAVQGHATSNRQQ